MGKTEKPKLSWVFTQNSSVGLILAVDKDDGDNDNDDGKYLF